MLVASRQKISKFLEIPSFSINHHPVKQVSSTKSLGVHINQNMNWECHIQNICKKIASALGAVKVAEHSFQEPMPNSPLLLSYLCLAPVFCKSQG